MSRIDEPLCKAGEPMRIEHPVLGPLEVSEMRDDELPLIMSSWMRSSDWRRKQMLSVIESDGEVLAVRDEAGLALGWIATTGNLVVHGYIKQGYRGLGLMRLLWRAAGSPLEVVDNPGNRRIARVLSKLTEDKDA